MKENLVAIEPTTIYPISRDVFMPEDENLSPSPVENSPKTTSSVESPVATTPRVKIPFNRARSVLETLSDIREGKEVVVDQQDLGDFRKFIVDFSTEENRDQVQKQIQDASAEDVILGLDKVVGEAEITLPDAPEMEAELKKKVEALKEEKKRVGLDDVDDNEDEESLKLSFSNELTYSLQLVQKAKNFGEAKLTAESLKDKVTVSEQLHGREADDSEPRKGPGTEYKGADWTAGLPGSVTDELGSFASDLSDIKALAGTDLEHALKRLSDWESTLSSFYHNKTVAEKASLTDEVGQLRGIASEGVLQMKKFLGNEEIRKMAEREQRLGKSSRITRIYYGESTIPMADNFDPKGDKKDDFKVKSDESDKFLKGLIDAGELDDDQLEVLSGLSKTTMDSFKEGQWNRTDVLSADRQMELYQKLKEDQMGWLLEKLDELPLKDMDLSLVAGTIAYKEFINAMSKEMLEEVQAFAKGVSSGYEAKYYFENAGMEALMKKSGEVQTSYEVVSQQIDGWHDVVAELEGLITREAIDREDDLPALRDDFSAELDAKVEAFKRRTRLATSFDPPDREIAKKKIEFAKEIKANWQSSRPDDWGALERGAVGLYVYTENDDGSVYDMAPKQEEDIAIDKLVLGDEKWKVGGFIGADGKADVDKVREYLYTVAQKVVKDRVASGKIPEKGYEARAKIAAFMAEWMFWRMAGRSAHWGSQGGIQKGEGGGLGEFQQFLVIGVQQYIVQESKGNGEAGRVMRKIMIGADTLQEYKARFVPGMAGGQNFNLGLFDLYSQYSAFDPGERNQKPLQKAGYSNTKGYLGEKKTMGFTRGFATGEQVSRLMEWENRRYDELIKSGLGPDAAWERIRTEMDDTKLVSGIVKFITRGRIRHVRDSQMSRSKDFLENYNNAPILTMASRGSRRALAAIANGEVRPWSDMTDFFGDDFNGPNALRKLIVTHDSGYLSNPTAAMLGEAAKLSEGRKRTWQRAKLMKDMAMGVLEFRSFWNKKITGENNWNTEDADKFLTDAKKNTLIVDRTKKSIEREFYPKAVKRGLTKYIPAPILENPLVHKLVYLYAKKGNIPLDAIFAAIMEYFKRLPGQIAQQAK